MPPPQPEHAGRVASPLLATRRGTGIYPAHSHGMAMHNASKEQREAVRQLLHSVIVADMANFTPDRFRDWTKALDGKFRRIGLTLGFSITSRRVHFTVKEIRSKRMLYRFAASTAVSFEESDVVIDLAKLTGGYA